MCAPVWAGAETYAPGELDRVLEGAALLVAERRAQGALVLEDGRPAAFGLTTFVFEAFIDAYLNAPHPHLGKRLLTSVLDASPPTVLEIDQIAQRNRAGGLQTVIANCAMHPKARDQGTVLGAIIDASFHVHRGYRIVRYVNEVFGSDVGIIESSRSYEIRRKFELRVGSSVVPSLVGTLTREQAVASSNPMLPLFAYSPPRLAFTNAEQRLLSEALSGGTDETLSARLGIPITAVKARWRRVQERVARVAPNLFPDGSLVSGLGRGAQWRHLVLQYVRNHPSELTPYVWHDS
jgi:hypothetical protein